MVGNTFPKLAANVRLMAAAPELYRELLNLVTAIESGITTETFLECSNKENSYLFTAKEVLRKCSIEAQASKTAYDDAKKTLEAAEEAYNDVIAHLHDAEEAYNDAKEAAARFQATIEKARKN